MSFTGTYVFPIKPNLKGQNQIFGSDKQGEVARGRVRTTRESKEERNGSIPGESKCFTGEVQGPGNSIGEPWDQSLRHRLSPPGTSHGTLPFLVTKPPKLPVHPQPLWTFLPEKVKLGTC